MHYYHQGHIDRTSNADFCSALTFLIGHRVRRRQSLNRWITMRHHNAEAHCCFQKSLRLFLGQGRPSIQCRSTSLQISRVALPKAATVAILCVSAQTKFAGLITPYWNGAACFLLRSRIRFLSLSNGGFPIDISRRTEADIELSRLQIPFWLRGPEAGNCPRE